MKNLLLVVLFFLANSLSGQCAGDLINDMLGKPELMEFMQSGNKKDKYAAWFELAKAGETTGKTDPATIQKVADNIEDVKDLGYPLWKEIDGLDYSNAVTHLKTRTPGKRKKGIVGCHDESVFFDQDVVRSVDASSNPGYTPEIGKTADQVEEVVITSNINHPTVPGVKIVEYKIPALSNTSPPLTTGLLATPSNGGIKTIYDPTIWTDAKIETSIGEAVMDYAKHNGNFVEGQPLLGKTKEGHEIEFFYRDGTVATFYFK